MAQQTQLWTYVRSLDCIEIITDVPYSWGTRDLLSWDDPDWTAARSMSFDVQKGWSSKGCAVVLENIAGDQDDGSITSRSKLDLRATVVLIISCNLGIYFIAYNFHQFAFAKMLDCFLPSESASIVAHLPMSSMYRDWFCWNSLMEVMVIDGEVSEDSDLAFTDSARTWTC